MKKNQSLKLWSLILGGLLVLTPLVTFAGTWGIGNDTFGGTNGAFATIFKFIVGLATVIFVILLLVGGIQYLAAAGNEDASKKAKALILDALIGLLIVGIAFAAGNWIITKMQLGERSYIDTNQGIRPNTP